MTPYTFGYLYAAAVMVAMFFFAIVGLSIILAKEAAKTWRDIQLMILEVDNKKWGDK